MSKLEFKTYKLDQLGTVNRGKSRHRPRNDQSLYGGTYPFIQTVDVKNAPYIDRLFYGLLYMVHFYLVCVIYR